MCINWTALGAVATLLGAIGTSFAAIVALWASYKANKSNENMLTLQEKEYIFSSKPIVECYLTTYKTQDKTPFIVLVVENYGSLTARNINMTIDYPDVIEKSEFGDEVKRLGKTKFTLAPRTRLSVPICWNKDIEMVAMGEIKITGNFSYDDIDNKIHSEEIAQVSLTVDEFNLFNAINKAGGNINGQT